MELFVNTEELKELKLLIAEDDPDDRFLMKEVFKSHPLPTSYFFARDGEELMDCLLRRRKFAKGNLGFSRPSVLILDLNMPKKDGREALREIKNHPRLKNIPIIVFTTSASKKDREYCYGLGVAEYITKPTGFEEYSDLMKIIEVLSTPEDPLI